MQHLARNPSDHLLVLLVASSRLDSKPKPFQFLIISTTKAGLLDSIREGWACDVVGSLPCILSTKLHNVKHVLKRWSKESFGDIFQMVRDAEKMLSQAEIAHEQGSSDHLLVELLEAQARLRNGLKIEEGFWRQKA